MITLAAPVAWSSPAAIATSLPKLRLSDTTPTRESTWWARPIAATVASVEPSSTKTISWDVAQRSRIGVKRASRGAMLSASLSTGTITESSVRCDAASVVIR